MTTDMGQFHEIFYEESFELLDGMESALLELESGSGDNELIHTIFRAAHSIKGGAGTFGFTNVSEFTHTMETLLDEMREATRPVNSDLVSLLLESGDAVRGMLEALRDGVDADEVRVAALLERLNIELGKDPGAADGQETPSEAVDKSADVPAGWKIKIKPAADFFQSGNDPLRIFRELSELGELETTVDTASLPAFTEFDPSQCYLSWELTLTGDMTREQIDDILGWIDEDCELSIEAQGAIASENTQSTPAVAADQSPDQDKVAEKVPAPAAAEKATPAAKKPAPAKKGSGSIRVDIGKIDSLINMVGELVITQSMLSLLGEDFDMSRIERLRNGLEQLERHTREMQESVMRIRMIPISFTFNRFPRLVHDISRQMDKKIELEMLGEATEVDKTVIELISDPLVHLVRNSLDHGIETPADRVAAGKPETGTIVLSACHQGGNIVIEIKDDGKGLDAEKLHSKAIEKGLISAEDNLTESQIYELIFKPGFSTAEKVTDVSGRGVGMDVVRRNIMSLGGIINIDSTLGQGTTISIHLPLTLAILDGQIAKVGDEVYIVPLASIIETIQLKPNMINLVAGRGEAFKLRDKFMPIIRLHDVFGIESCESKQLSEGLLVVVEADGRQCGIFVDDLLGQQQVVIKSMETNYKRVQGVSGATILGDGSVALILDMSGIIRRWQTNNATLQVVDGKAAGL